MVKSKIEGSVCRAEVGLPAGKGRVCLRGISMRMAVTILIYISMKCSLSGQGTIAFGNPYDSLLGVEPFKEIAFMGLLELDSIISATPDFYKSIVIDFNKLDTWPGNLFQKKQITDVAIYSSDLHKIDSRVVELENLNHLRLYVKRFCFIPYEIRNALLLERIYVRCNSRSLYSIYNSRRIIRFYESHGKSISITIGSINIDTPN